MRRQAPSAVVNQPPAASQRIWSEGWPCRDKPFAEELAPVSLRLLALGVGGKFDLRASSADRTRLPLAALRPDGFVNKGFESPTGQRARWRPRKRTRGLEGTRPATKGALVRLTNHRQTKSYLGSV